MPEKKYSQLLYYETHKDQYKEYYKKNKNKINNYNREYWKTYIKGSNKKSIQRVDDCKGLTIQRNITVLF